MRVLMVNAQGPGLHAGGAERSVGALTVGLLARGHAVEILQGFPDGSPVLPGTRRTVLHAVDWHDSRVRTLENHLGDLLSLPRRRVEEIIRAAEPDVVHTHNLPGFGTGVWEVARRVGVPVVHTAHDYHLLCPRVTLSKPDGEPCSPGPFLCGARTRRMARWAGAVAHYTGVSQYVVDVHRTVFGATAATVIRNPVQTDVQATRPPGSAPRVLGYIGSLDANKGVDRLLRAAPALAAAGCSIRIAGDGRLRAEVEAAAADPALHVVYDGTVGAQAKSEFLSACDVGVVPSVWPEPGGPNRTMVEWLLARRPVLLSRRGGLGEVVDSYPGAIPIEPTTEEIVAAMAALREPAAWEAALERAGRAHVDGDEAAALWVDAYERVLLGAAAGR